ncbi:hypothetical protein AYL99_00921 [Fonsecaea erecta]|uniref:Uncharacterized protein n=1 Tax=Fonsecaea erecta TaxID=1367422 RepID=A0A178ZYS2_9EURO|nr:hypothetical protein AYL99_00921 [Fonsecaea erecta]OAP64949.1 hypothetical protein AYL99_00921 [Fonsecaea erecta]
MSDEQPHVRKDVLWKPFVPALYVGAATGACGAAYGGIAGTLIQTSNPLAYTAISATQWFCAGTTFFYCRSVLLAGPLSRDKDLHRVAASGIAGSCSGAVIATFLPRGSFVTGGIMFGVIAALSQAGLNTTQGSPSFAHLSSRLKNGFSSFSPMKSLSDKEYEDLLLDKLLRIDAEIAILDDKIASLRAATDQRVHMEDQEPKSRPS